jgi:TRAP-type C4-dicarboxylate transport system substrate-binding protein
LLSVLKYNIQETTQFVFNIILRRETVRKVVFILVALMITVALVMGCAAPAPAPKPSTTPAPAAVPAAPKVYEWKMASFATSSMDFFKIDLPQYVKMVNEYTQGRVKITLFAESAIVSTAEMLASTSKNMIQAMYSNGGYDAGVVPVGNVEYAMPMSYLKADDTFTIMQYRGLEDILRKAYAKQGVYYLGYEPGIGNRLLTTKPIKTLADFKGMKIRCLGTFGNWMAKLGATPVGVPIPELYMALKLGTVDGVISGTGVLEGQKLYEVAKYLQLPAASSSEPLHILVNQGEWNALPDDLKSIMTLVTRDWGLWAGIVQVPASLNRQMATMAAGGMQVVQLAPDDAAAVQAAAIEIWDDAGKKDEDSAKAVALFKEYFKQQGRIK